MGFYFDDRLSIRSRGASVNGVLETVARRYVGANPPHPLTLRAYSTRGIAMGPDYRYHADFDVLLPGAVDGSAAVAWSALWADAAGALKFDVSCLSPMDISINGRKCFTSDIFTERDPGARHRISIALEAGWNRFIVRCRKTRAGFGWVFGSWLGKHPYYFMLPDGGSEGREGWLYAGPLEQYPDDTQDLAWLPGAAWDPESLAQGRLRRLFGPVPGYAAVARTRCFLTRTGRCRLEGANSGPVVIHAGSQEIFREDGSGSFRKDVGLPFGAQEITVSSVCGRGAEADSWGFDLKILENGRPVPFESPWPVEGSTDAWLYAGPFPADAVPSPDSLGSRTALLPGADGPVYWRLGAPDTEVRLYNDNPLFGRWNYPLGVTLYGLLHASAAVGSAETRAYVEAHVRSCIDSFPYALWDKARYGGATAVHANLTGIDSLDDCGSFGSLLLEAATELGLEGFRDIADYVAEYIAHTQARLPDGTFYRRKLMHVFHEDTLWADDLYMSVPFLCRYSRLTGDRAYMDDAAAQFLGFKERLFIPEKKLMSHVFDLRRGMATGVPWGRGNGWTLFSLSELLAVLPVDHEKRPALLSMFRDLAAGCLACQDKEGMWHQVLTHPDSYPEASCTSMFAYAFSRGVRLGWYADPAPYTSAVFAAWEALTSTCIDSGGSVYGVCRGSEFSFTPEYYKNELSWNLNDTHGVGIVLLAGVEVLRLREFLSGAAAAPGARPRGPVTHKEA